MPHAQNLRLCLLGTFRIERDTHLIALSTRKVESLLAYLALFAELHSREKLAALFWGDSTDEHARHSLRSALTTLRTKLGDDLLLADRETVQLNPDYPLWVDAREFQQFAIGDQPSAIELYRGDLLADFYDDWIEPERERLRALYLDSLLQLAHEARSHSQYPRAIELAHKVLASDPANEKAYQHIIFCLAATGDRISALKQYDECQKKLRDELGVEPSSETVALCEQIERELTGALSREALLTNVPTPLTSFIGRQSEMAEIKRLLAMARLLTLTGAGGCGKTRLAIQIATDLAGRDVPPERLYKNGVWWVELAALSDRVLVPQKVAQVFDLRESADAPLITVLTNYLCSKELLLVLDNCEHLIEACAQLADTLLSACPKLQILATSREALGITGEVTWYVPSLESPDPHNMPPLASLPQYDAIRLFTERAQAAVPHWQLADHAGAATRICCRLDGIPLAIELAAARLKVLAAEQIAERLDDRFQLLTGSSRTAPPRHRTLRATIDWSYDLLAHEERVLFQRLAVFVGGCILAAVESVCSGNGLAQDNVLDVLTRLVDKSIVVVEGDRDERRYRMLETIRQYAHEKLAESSESDDLRLRHLDFFVKFAQDTEPKLNGPEQLEWLERLEIENDNLRAALEWSLGAGRVERGLRIVSALRRFWEMRGYWREGYEHVKNLLNQPGAARRTLERANGLLVAARMTGWEGLSDVEKSRQYAIELVRIARELGAEGKRVLALGLCVWGDDTYEQDPVAARAMVEEASAIARELGEDWLLGYTLYMRGWLLRVKDKHTADQLSRASLAYFKSLGDGHWIAKSSMLISVVYFSEGELELARQGLEQVLPFFRQTKAQLEIFYALITLGEIARAEGKYDEAKKAYREILETSRELGVKWAIALTLANLGFVAIHDGELASARSYLAESLPMFQELNLGLDAPFMGFAGVAAVAKRPRQAVQLIAFADHWMGGEDSRTVSITDKIEYERYLTLARSQLDGATFNAAWEEGRKMTLEQAIEYALTT